MTAADKFPSEIRNQISELIQWINSLDASFAFLLALPFLVALAGLLAEFVRQRRARSSRDKHSDRVLR